MTGYRHAYAPSVKTRRTPTCITSNPMLRSGHIDTCRYQIAYPGINVEMTCSRYASNSSWLMRGCCNCRDNCRKPTYAA